MKRIIGFATLLLALISVVGCSEKVDNEQACLDYLYKYMPLPDSVAYPESYWRANVRKTLEVREKMAWNIPDKEFRHFVLPLRVNNETLDDFRTLYADTLCARVRGLSLADAALEINHWCHEQATYQPSDGRTSSPCATMLRGIGRCGEESVLAVAALRAAGIPARQVYTPRWAHTDDNHAWVEVWVDGSWHFLGACEPEPELDRAWFNAPVSRAMILHTKAFGNYSGSEDVISSTPCYTEINCIRGYVPARRSIVTVLDGNGNPVKDAVVEFKIYNYGEYFTVARYKSDSHGHARLDMGLGDMMVWASKDGLFGLDKIDGEYCSVVLDHRMGERYSMDFEIVPPEEHPLESNASPLEVEINAGRLTAEDCVRAGHDHSNPAVAEFLARHNDAAAKDLVFSLSEKDRGDVTSDVLEDAYAHCSGSFIAARDCPRVELEALKPYFSEIGKGLDLGSVEEVADWVRDNIKLVDDRNPQGLSMSPVDVWRSRMADAHSRDIFQVALCRALGFEAQLDSMTGDAVVQPTDKGRMEILYEGGSVPEYYHHFTLSRIKDGSPELLEYNADSDHCPWNDIFPLDLEKGDYLLVSGNRMADGSVLSHCEYFTVYKDSTIVIPLVMRQSEDKVQVIGAMDPERKYHTEDGSEVSILSTTGRGYFLIAVLDSKGEPSDHAVRELAASAELLNSWGRPVLILGPVRVSGLDNVHYGTDPDESIASMLVSGCNKDKVELPVIAICDSFGRIVYCSQGYNTSLSGDLDRTISGI